MFTNLGYDINDFYDLETNTWQEAVSSHATTNPDGTIGKFVKGRKGFGHIFETDMWGNTYIKEG